MGVRITPIKMGLDTCYIVKEDGVIAIDGGGPHKIKKFEQGIAKAEISPDDIKLLVNTHGHWDHIGSSQEIKDLTGAKTLLHKDDMHFLEEGKTLQPPGFTFWGKLIISPLKVISPLITPPTVEIDIVASDEEISLEEFGVSGVVIHTPGHSWGSVSVLLETGDVFVGDLAMNALPMRLNPGLPIFGDDIELVKQSWRNLLEKGAKTVYPAHGKPFSVEIVYQAVM